MLEQVMDDDPWDYESPVDDLEEDIDAAERTSPGTRARIHAGLERRRLARQLATRRRALGVSLEAAAAHIGLGAHELAAMEEGDGDFGLDDLAVYADSLGLRVSWRLTPKRGR
ncbi:MAG: helix-turn-helix transcriptional regulator [Actinobacteria bacterium]|nr:helix-turn-helix transcriptional regulator [Actinomycetota bacterium]